MSKNSTLPGTSTTDDAVVNPKPGQQSSGGDDDDDDDDDEQDSADDAQGDPQFTPITSQDELDRLISKRLGRYERTLAKKYGDLGDLARKAKAFDDIEEGGKTESQKLTERLQQVEKQLEDAQKEARTADIKAKRIAFAGDRIPEVLLHGDDEKGWKKQLEAYQAAQGHTGKRPGRAPGSGAGDPTRSPSRGAGRESAQEYLKHNKI